MSNLAARLGRLTPQERLLLEQRLAARARPVQTIPRRKPGEEAPLSFSQRRLWYLEQLNPGTATYNAPYAFRGRGNLDVAALRQAAHKVVERHTVLRTTISTSAAGEPFSRLATEWDPLLLLPAAHQGEAGEKEAMRLIESAAQQPFDIAHDVLVRIVVATWDTDEFLILIAAHHIAWDGVSKGIFFRELGLIYDALVAGREPGLPEPLIEYADFSLWQQRTFTGPAREREVAFWKDSLAGAPAYLDLPLDKPRPAVQRFQGAKIPFELPAALLARSQAFSRAERTTLYATLLAAFKVFLLAFASQGDLCVATPFAGRDEPETQEIIGFFTNTVVLRTKIDAALDFRTILARVRDGLLSAQEHQQMPMDQLVEILQAPRDLTRMPLAQVNFRLQGGKAATLQLTGTELMPLPLIDTLISKFDMALEVASVAGEAGYLEYNTDLFAEARMKQIPAAYQALLEDIVDEPGLPVGQLAAFQIIGELSPRRRRIGLNAATSRTRTPSHA